MQTFCKLQICSAWSSAGHFRNAQENITTKKKERRTANENWQKLKNCWDLWHYYFKIAISILSMEQNIRKCVNITGVKLQHTNELYCNFFIQNLCRWWPNKITRNWKYVTQLNAESSWKTARMCPDDYNDHFQLFGIGSQNCDKDLNFGIWNNT